MLNVTDNALEYLANLLDQQGADDSTVVRCTVQDGNLAIVPDNEQPGDVAFSHGERTVLVVEEELSQALDGREFDVQTKDGETALTLN